MSSAMPEAPTAASSATGDLELARRDLDALGCCAVPGVLGRQDLADVRRRVVEQAAAEAEAGLAYFDSGGANQRVWNLMNKGDIFHQLVVHPVALALVGSLLGDRFLVSSLTANIAGPGGEAQPLHQDQGYVPPPHPGALVANVAWCLDDVHDANGGTRFVPTSHRWKAGPAPDPAMTVAAECPAGGVVVFDGRIFHGTGANRTGSPRHVVLAYYCRPFIRQQENVFLSLAPEVEARLSEPVRRLLGFEVWGGLGVVEGPRGVDATGLVGRPEQPILQMGPAPLD